MKETTAEKRIVCAKLRYLRIAPKKVRVVSRVLKGMSVERALAELEARAKRASRPLAGVLRSAIANAVNTSKIESKTLVVKNVLVDPGPPFKRTLPRAMGRATPLWKRTSHVTVVLEEAKDVKASVSGDARRKALKAAIAVPEAGASVPESRREPNRVAGRQGRSAIPVKKPSRGFVQKTFRRKAI